MDQRRLAGGALVALGAVLAVIQVVHAVRQTSIPVAIAVDAVPFVAMALAVAFVGGWLLRADDDDGPVRVVAWSAGGMLTLAAVAALVLFSRRVTTGSLARASYLTVDLVTVGALTGALVGLYDARSRARARALAAERDRIEAFAEKAADVNNYGRAINGARSLDAVGAYVVEAFGTLGGVGETALVRLESGGVHAYADTVRSVDEATLADLAAAARGDPSGEVVVRDAPEDVSLPPGVGAAVTALVDETAGVVIVALRGDDAPLGEEDRQLLELIVSHAGAAVGGLEAA